MISSEWKVDKVDYVKVRLKWWHLRKTNVANITMASNTGILYIPNVLPDKEQTQDEAVDDFLERLYEAMREPIKDPDTPVYAMGHVYPPTEDDQAFLNELLTSWHTPLDKPVPAE